jgi:hypothetical protein
MKMLSRPLMLGVVLVSALSLARCSQTPLNSPTSPTADATSAGTALVGDEVPGDPGDGHVHTEFLQVCKTADSTVAGTFTIAQTGPGNGSFISPITVQPGTCVVAAVGNNVLSVTETSAGFVSATIDTLNGTTLTTGQPFVNGSSVTLSGQLGHAIRVKNVIEEPPGGEGCTPGFWRNERHYGLWTGYTPGADFDATFGVNFFNPNITLGVAVELNGGGLNALARHGVAGLLSAASASVDYQYTTAQVIAIVQGTGAYAGLSVEARKDLLEAANEAGCPL